MICTDVLEHVEPEYLSAVLADLKRCVLKVGYFVIATGPSEKFYADGRNAHLTQQPAPWWIARLEAFFQVGWHQVTPKDVFILVEPMKEVKINGL